jgi:glycerate kinase
MIVIAPDKFKGSLSARAIAAVVAEQFRIVDSDVTVHEAPIADGGEGTVDLMLDHGADLVQVEVRGPLGEPVIAKYARRNGTAVLEVSSADGLFQLRQQADNRTALSASAFGVGELILDAIEGGADSLVIGLGGSASTDGGAGLASALGARLTSATDAAPPWGGAGIEQLANVDLDPLREVLRPIDLVLATDVDNPLLEPSGAAAIYGPQKGADGDTVRLLERGLAHWASLLLTHTNVDVRSVPGAGAAGGAGFPLLAAANAQIQPGVDVLMALTAFEKRLEGATLMIVGKGSLDRQSLWGKGPVGAARLARSMGIGVVAIVGVNTLSRDELDDAAIDRVYAMTDIESDLSTCMENTNEILAQLAHNLAFDEMRRPARRLTTRDDV